MNLDSGVRAIPLLRVVAAGAAQPRPGSGELQFKATILLSPKLVDNTAEPGFDIARWPSLAAAWLLEELQSPRASAALFASVIARGESVDTQAARPVQGMSLAIADVKEWKYIDALWQQSLAVDRSPPWKDLMVGVGESLACKPAEAPAATLASADASSAKDKLDYDGALLVSLPDFGKMPPLGSVLPIKMADMALNEERCRALRVGTKVRRGEKACEPSPEAPPAAASAPVPASAVGNGATAAEQLRAKHLARYNEAVEATQPLRLRAAQTFAQISGALKTLPGSCGKMEFFDGLSSPIPSGDEGDLVASGTGTHTFGTWLQRRSDMKQVAPKNSSRLAEPAKPGASELTESELVRRQSVLSRFLALVDDPMLSRLFCLAVDVSFGLNALPGGSRATYLHLWLGQRAADRDHPRRLEPLGGRRAPGSGAIVTAAKLNNSAFWPVSVFEAGIVDQLPRDDHCLAPLIEQQDGHWRLGRPLPAGGTAPVESLRYDVVTIDVRRAMDAKPSAGLVDRNQHEASQALPDGGSTDDFGQRQATAGFVLLDRGRASQVLRELALAQRGATCAGALILYAEDLTIGRRVDVAAVRPGVDAAKVTWRSLMQRLTRYVFRPSGMSRDDVGSLWRAVSLLIPGSQRTATGLFIDEGSFVVAARHVPTLPASTNGKDGMQAKVSETRWDVAADESIFTWDGTPAAVLTEGASEQRVEGLPYQRIHDLPQGDTIDGSPGKRRRQLRHAPLRFGVPYAFRMRSVFAGHGSPEPQAPELSERSDWMLPASRAVDGTSSRVAAPRRFLRHDSILAPTLLLPRHLAMVKLKAMGFEQLDQAIVRTQPDGPRRPDDRLASDHSPYVGLSERLQPVSTLRVFIAPECSYEEAVRHGVFDVKDPERVRQGGLRRAAYDQGREAGPVGDVRRRGFPCVVTRQFASMDPGGALYYREYIGAAAANTGPAPEDGGIPVFEPLRAVRKPESRVGWLPDPSVSHFSVRARVRGSDRYLEGDLRAELYEGKYRYPDALPLAVEVVALPKRRPGSGLASSIRELADAEIAPVVGLDAQAGIVARENGVPVRLLRLKLYEGEDFDIDVCCIPTEEALANLFALPETMAIQRSLAAGDAALSARLQKLCGQADLKAYSSPSRQSMTGIGGHLVPDGGRVLQCARDVIETVRGRWPIEEVAAITRLRVCHAIPWPTRAPGLDRVVLHRPASVQADKLPEAANVKGSTTLLLSGAVELDLEQADGFELLAQGVALTGRPIDDPSRGRSLIARRAGRWPTSITKESERCYVSPQDVLGFKVDVSGRVSLEQEQLTLMRVDHLPSTLAIGPIVSDGPMPEVCVARTPDTEPENPIFELSPQRPPCIQLQPLHAAALASKPIHMVRWRPAGTQVAKNDLQRLRVELPQQITDTRARRLTLTVRALSRFAETFETAPMYVDGKERLLRRRQALSPHQQSTSTPKGSEFVAWMCATERPPACEPLRPEPSFMVSRQAKDCCGSIVHSVARRAMVRLYFRRGWFASGEGERVGIVLWPPRYFDPGMHDHLGDRVRLDDGRAIRIEDFEDKDLGRAGAYVTRWGGDPIRRDPRQQEAVLIPPSSFVDAPEMRPNPPDCPPSVHEPEVVAHALMPIPRDPPKDGAAPAAAPGSADTPADGYLPVTLLTYAPCFDFDREQWYVDVDLRSHRPSEPFVRFGLVRYQPKAISPELAVSEPVTVMAPMLPHRQVDVHTARRNDGQYDLHVTMRGPGSAGIRNLNVNETFGPGGPLADAAEGKGGMGSLLQAFESLQRPWMRVWLSREYVSADGATHREPVASTDAAQALEVKGTIVDDELLWQRKETLSAGWTSPSAGAMLVAYVEEVDIRMPASYSKEPIAPVTMFDESTFADSGPRFSARIPFMELGSVSTPASPSRPKG